MRATAGAGQVIAIVGAYDDPNAEADLNVFGTAFGLPLCTTANGYFTTVDQDGDTKYPKSNSGWALEISLDVQWAYAIAPSAHFLLVEAKSAAFKNLMTAEDYAKTHANYVSNSWGTAEFVGESAYDAHFVQPDVSFFVSSGDMGIRAQYLSSSGGGCSLYENATIDQQNFSTYGQVNCVSKRATPDISLAADLKSGVSVYDSAPYLGQTCWWRVGGTSAAARMWAGRAANSGETVNADYVYGNRIHFRDVTSGNNGTSALTGYDLVTGRGSWND